MVSDLEIYQTAKIIITQYGDDAIIEAALRQDKFSKEGDIDGARIWQRIGAAIESLKTPPVLAKDTIN